MLVQNKSTYDFDQDNPALVPEIIADVHGRDREQRDRLCARARYHWRTLESFRRSFAGKDVRDVLAMWFSHWVQAEEIRTRRGLPIWQQPA